MQKSFKILILILFVLAVTAFYIEGGSKYLELENLQAEFHLFKTYYSTHPVQLSLMIFGGIVFLAAVSIPGSIVLTLLVGALMEPLWGTVLVVLASTLGALIAFFFARYVFKDLVEESFRAHFKKMAQKIREQGESYLFTLRLLPASPFVVINLIMGLTTMRPWSFTWITFVGMFPGTFIYVYAGREFSKLDSIKGIFSAPIIISLLTLSFLPYFTKYLLRLKTKKESSMQHDHRNAFYSISGVEFEGEDMAKFGKNGPEDASIKAYAADSLKAHDEFKDSDIQVEVEDGTVFLKGVVPDQELKLLAHKCMNNIKGVSEVVNQLSVR